MHGRSLTTLVRAGIFAAVSVGVSANGHAVHSGHDVPLTGTLLGGALMLAIGWALAKRERGGGIILGWMLWGQLALHLIFALTEGGTGAHVTHAAARVGEETASDPTLGMLAAHLGAALVCALWLRRGEAAAFRLARQLRTLLAGMFQIGAAPPAVPCPPWAGQHRDNGAVPAPRTVPQYAVSRRGPPRPRLS